MRDKSGSDTNSRSEKRSGDKIAGLPDEKLRVLRDILTLISDDAPDVQQYGGVGVCPYVQLGSQQGTQHS